MARIVGRLRPDDEHPHAPGPEPHSNESVYANFFDAKRSFGGFLRLGNRPNQGHAEVTVCLFLPDGRVLFTYGRPKLTGHDAFHAGGLCFEILEPTERIRTRYRGALLELAEPRAMADPRRAFRESPRREVVLELVHEAVGPPYGSAQDARESAEPAERQFAKAHYEQHTRSRGSVILDGTEHPIDGYGLRDHSWGPRSWQALHRYEWLTLNFGPDLGAMVSVIQRDPEGRDVRRAGVVVRGSELDPIVDAEIEAEYEANGLYHRALCARVGTRSGERFEITGSVRSFVPLRNRRGGRTTHIGEGMTEWRLGDRVGFGISEFLRQLD